MANRKIKKKLPWKSMEITKVRLNPEQAVLACCEATAKDLIAEVGHQCGGIACGMDDEASASYDDLYPQVYYFQNLSQKIPQVLLTLTLVFPLRTPRF